jgi:FKBP-type peptidyl-prolyl cis-trans isomerase SlpA
MKIERGSRAKFHYRLSFTDGRVIEETPEDQPLNIIVGDSDLLLSFEDRLLGLEPGDARRFEVPCLDAYGLYDAENMHIVPRADFPPDMKPEPGQVVAFATPEGEEAVGVVKVVGDNEVTVNFSHPLAGHDLVFEVRILEVMPPISSG